jgi:tetratricopeptide (TPR) repeat protein
MSPISAISGVRLFVLGLCGTFSVWGVELIDDAQYTKAAADAFAAAHGDPMQLVMATGKFMDARDYARAESILADIIARYHVQNSMMFSNLSVFQGKQGKFKDAIASADKALAIQPDSLHARAVKASWLYESGDHDGGLKLFQSIAVPEAGDSKESLYYGCATCFYASVGDVEKLQSSMDATIRLGDEHFIEFVKRDVVFDRYRKEPWFVTRFGVTVR